MKSVRTRFGGLAVAVALAVSGVECSESGSDDGAGDLRAQAQEQLDAMMTGDADVVYEGSSKRCRASGTKDDLQADLDQVQRYLPEMTTWRFKILSIEEGERSATVRTIAVDGDGKVVDQDGYSNNEDDWPFVLEDDRWRNDFCNP